MTTMTDQARGVILGVDIHQPPRRQRHRRARPRAGHDVSNDDRGGSRRAERWTRSVGTLVAAGVEGTGSYDAGLARHLAGVGVRVVEVNRPNRQRRHRRGKSDPTDAEAGARAVLSGEARALPKARSGIVESIRVLQVTRASAMKGRTSRTRCGH